MVAFNFNATDIDPQGGASVWEPGIYPVQITNSELKETKSKTGWMLVLTLTSVDPLLPGKTIISRLNIQNDNATAVEIAYRDLSAISHVCGVLNWQDSHQLHGRPFKIAVEKKPRQDDPTKFGNEITAYLDMNGNAPTKGSAAGGGGGGAPAAPQAPQTPVQQQAPAQQPAQQPVQQQQQPAPQAQAPAFVPPTQQQAAPPAGGAPAPTGGGAPTPPWLQQNG